MDVSSQIWNTLANIHGSKTTFKLMFYRRALHSQRKGDLSKKEFLMKIKNCCDNLASCGEIIGEQEHVTCILNRSSSKYETVVTVIIINQVSYDVKAITTMLLDAEAKLQATLVDMSSSANMVTNRPINSTDSSQQPSYRPPSTPA
ncbi:hypothetical protein J1N35_044616 [Gossypium stocksii]|uniref:Retrovirus-related Pol polyprotein from transposon TNT 1-94 n=1 Tax=Gossypium stocksii TaxID=47602 RepID=A0A9D3U9L4_9ROSI|nr:hypothetical protein J1N35_044616 [Gossypium stocksii]